MPTLPPTERWSDRTYTPRQGATRSFDVPGYPTAAQAIAAVINNFGVRPEVAYPDDQFMYPTMGGISARNNQGPTTWIVTVAYVHTSVQQQLDMGTDNPLLQPTRWQFFLCLESVNVEIDVYGNPIGNSAGTPVEPKDTRTINSLEIVATRFYTDFSLATALKYMNRVNLGVLTIKSLGPVPEGCVKCTLIAPTQEIVLSQPKPIEVVHRFKTVGSVISDDPNDPGFWLRKIDKGYAGWYLDPTDPTKIYQGDFSEKDPSHAGEYRYRTVETLLDGEGRPLDPNVRIGDGPAASVKTPSRAPDNRKLGSDVIRRGTGIAVALNFWVERKIDFGPLIAGL